MKKLSYPGLTWLTFALVGLSACVDDPIVDPTSGNGGAKQLWLDVVVPGASPKEVTRAVTAGEENTIQNVDVIAFRINGSNETFDYWASARLAPGNTPGAATQTFTANLRAQPYQQRFVVIANASRQVNETMSKSWRGASKAQVLADMKVYFASGQDRWTATSPSDYQPMPMWGESAPETVTTATTNLASTISLMRMLARIDVKLDTSVAGLTGQFKMKSVALYNTNTGGNIVPDAAKVVSELRDGQTYLRVNATTIPTELQPYGARSRGPVNYTDFTAPGVTDVSMIGAIYTFEVANSTSAAEAASIVVGGLYGTDTTPSYYRLELWQMGSTTVRLDLLRNSQYVVNITAVRGRGHATAEEAFTSQSVNMTANILAWNQPAMDNVVFDSQNVLATDKDQINLFSNQYTGALATGENAVQVRTDVPAGWTVSGITNADGTGTAAWVRVSPTTGTGNNTNTQMTVSADTNTTGAARTAIVTISAGRLRLPVRVTQNTYPSLALGIVGAGNQEIQEIIFPSQGGVPPAPQSFTVNWQPASNPVRVQVVQVGRYEFQNPGGNPTINNGAPYTNMPWPETSGTRNFTVSPTALAQYDLDNDPFTERSSRFEMSVNNGQTTMTKSILLRQLQYNLRVEDSQIATQNTTPADPFEGPWYAQLGGRRFTYNVRSNSTWRISAINETRQVDANVPLIAYPGTNGDNVYVNAQGRSNYTPGGGFPELFTTDNTRRGNSGYADITYSSDPPGRFQDVRTRIFFPSAQFNIYGIVKMADQNANFYNIFAGQNRQNSFSTRAQHLHPVFNEARNFGTNLNGSGNDATPSSSVFTGPVNVNGVNYNDGSNLTVADINDAVTAGADMLFIGGSTTFGNDVGQAIFDNFLSRQKPVLLAVEDRATLVSILRLIHTGMGALISSTVAMNGNAPVYQFRDIPGDPILQGPFGDLRNQYWGCDGNGSIAHWFTNRTNIISYSNAVNYTGGTDAPPTGLTQESGTTMADGMTCLRFTNYPFIFVADGGFAGAFNQTDSARAPALINTSTNLPAPRPGYGGGPTKRDTWNAYFIANVVAWAIQRRTTQ